jgi:hypothetical protein
MDAALYIVKPRKAQAPPPTALCPVCHRDPGRDAWSCDRCKTRMCEPCFWGRVATLDEWRDYLDRWIEPEECRDDSPPCLCPECRAKREDSATPAEPPVVPLRRRAPATTEG